MLSFIGLIGLVLAAAFSLGLWCLRDPIAQLASSESLAPGSSPCLGGVGDQPLGRAAALRTTKPRLPKPGLAELSGRRAMGVAALLALPGHGLGLICQSPPVPSARACIFGSAALGGSYANSWQVTSARPRSGRKDGTPLFPALGALVGSHLMATVTGAAPLLYISHAYGSNPLGQFALVMSTIFLPASLLGAASCQVYYQRAAADWSRRPRHP